MFLLLSGIQKNAFAQQNALPATSDTARVIEKEDSSQLRTVFNLLSFTGSGSIGQTILSWKTDSRSHFTGFALERSLDETDFTPIGHIELAGISKTNSFTYADNKPVAGRNFYRLRMTDSSGKNTYSTVISIMHTVTGNLQIHFDSQSGTIGLTGMEPGSQYQLKLYNCNGQMMLQKTVTTVIASISISQLPHGLYVVYTADGTAATVSRKIIW